jgi:hypothetical protein
MGDFQEPYGATCGLVIVFLSLFSEVYFSL